MTEDTSARGLTLLVLVGMNVASAMGGAWLVQTDRLTIPALILVAVGAVGAGIVLLALMRWLAGDAKGQV